MTAALSPLEERLLSPLVRRRCGEDAVCLQSAVSQAKRKNLITNTLLFGGIALVATLGGWKKLFGVTAISLAAMRMSLEADLWRER